ncbi:MAG TPA: prepilin-type N-terminal cleavage/methylation domain-containing protein [Candidatus Paceibacterota bacterium]|nr:prepilin-type N-terminal cleavage/methylation domain-containing protein [Candidatus Paceibacterota bacterium]
MSTHSVKGSKGFTLIELLVVIAIIGILSSVVLASLSSARAKSRDARRISDMGQLQLALEMYYDASSTYPTIAGLQTWTTVPATGIGYLKPSYIPNIPDDPGSNSYYYCALAARGDTTCTGSVSATAYLLGADLEINASSSAPLATDGDTANTVFFGRGSRCNLNSGTEACYDLAP